MLTIRLVILLVALVCIRNKLIAKPPSKGEGEMVAFTKVSTGLFGNNINKELLARNLEVKALVRRQHDRGILGPVVRCVQGKLRSVDKSEKQWTKTDVLIHAAACNGDFDRTGARSDLIETNVTDTVPLLEAAAPQGIRNIIDISSTKAEQKLGVRFRLLSETMTDTVRLFETQNLNRRVQ